MAAQTHDTHLVPVTDPAQIQRFAQEAMAEGNEPVQLGQEIKKPFAQEVFDGIVELPAGLYNPITGVLVRTAEVRELTGADEEALAKVQQEGRVLLAMLERAVVKVGDEPASASLLDSLVIGDRDALLLGIRRATFGDEIEFKQACPFCEHVQEVTLSVSKIPVRKHDSPDERELTVETRKGTVEVSLPTGSLQKKMMRAEGKSLPELNTMMLAECVQSCNGMPVLGDGVKQFGMADRAKLIDAIAEAMPGPRLEEVKRTCVGCQQEVAVPMRLSDLFRS